MPRVESALSIYAPLAAVWPLAQDVEKFPAIMPDLVSVKVLEREQTTPLTMRVVSEWKGHIKQFNRTMLWVEEDIWNDEEHTCHFWQVRGDFTEYRGVWRFVDAGDRTEVYLTVDYVFDIPLLGALMKKVLQKLMQTNADGMLQSLKQEAERQAAQS
jgi:ribosome-associated toxin RatA of RatAB toxin-antitoxin module